MGWVMKPSAGVGELHDDAAATWQSDCWQREARPESRLGCGAKGTNAITDQKRRITLVQYNYDCTWYSRTCYGVIAKTWFQIATLPVQSHTASTHGAHWSQLLALKAACRQLGMHLFHTDMAFVPVPGFSPLYLVYPRPVRATRTAPDTAILASGGALSALH